MIKYGDEDLTGERRGEWFIKGRRVTKADYEDYLEDKERAEDYDAWFAKNEARAADKLRMVDAECDKRERRAKRARAKNKPDPKRPKRPEDYLKM